jgi:hypothetical protein
MYFAVKNGWDMRSSAIAMFDVSSYAACAMKCESYSTCVSFTLAQDANMCYLFPDVGSGGAPSSVGLSGYKGGKNNRI